MRTKKETVEQVKQKQPKARHVASASAADTVRTQERIHGLQSGGRVLLPILKVGSVALLPENL